MSDVQKKPFAVLAAELRKQFAAAMSKLSKNPWVTIMPVWTCAWRTFVFSSRATRPN